jgi:hypothetical protein
LDDFVDDFALVMARSLPPGQDRVKTARRTAPAGP